MAHIIEGVANFIWGEWLIYIILATGFFFSFKLKFIQIRKFNYIFKKFFNQKKNQESNTINSFQAIMSALGSCVGNGNIIGVATAIISGGPGALFWMWVSGILGMSIKYAEIYLGIKYREKNQDGDYQGGPMYYLSKGTKFKFFGGFYAFFLLVQNSGGTLVQGNVIKDVLHNFFKVESIITSFVLLIVTYFIISGGFKRLAKVTERLVPFMTLFYICGCMFIIFFNYDKIFYVFENIFKSAFNFNSALGGALGYSVKDALRFGIARGVYSNEAGEGTVAIFYSKITDVNLKEDSLYGIVDVFIDTILICTMSGVVLLITTDLALDLEPTHTMIGAFESVNYFFKYILGGVMILFGFSSMLGQWLLGRESFKYLTKRLDCKVYDYIFLCGVFVAPMFSSKTIWYIQDICLTMIILPNIYGLIALYKEIK
ncbi:sodium:alanine symporter family protein [uncultured Cetobacterium sp.]|uniref:alanine/glycine:cation symporter family protein n=1 Tax=uncultured Cetobacterium sp. TaxID=527638 RepID=UPI00260D7F6D|nr:amino acid carrier protein [uncultured Cetobacterium sp.]